MLRFDNVVLNEYYYYYQSVSQSVQSIDQSLLT